MTNIRQIISSSFMRNWPRKFESEDKISTENIVSLLVAEYNKNSDLTSLILGSYLKPSTDTTASYLKEQNLLIQKLVENNQPELESGWGGVDSPEILYQFIRHLALFDILSKNESLQIGTYLLLSNLINIGSKPTHDWVCDLVESYKSILTNSIKIYWNPNPIEDGNNLATFERSEGEGISLENFDMFSALVQKNDESLRLLISDRKREFKLLWWMSIKHTYSASNQIRSYRSFDKMSASLYMAYDVFKILKDDLPAPYKVKATILECLYSIWPDLAILENQIDATPIKEVIENNKDHFQKLNNFDYFYNIINYMDTPVISPANFSILIFDLLQAKHLLTLIED